MIRHLKRTWNKFKEIVNTRNLSVRYEENDEDYYIFAEDGNRTYFCNIPIESGNADYEEFLEDYKISDDSSARKTKTISAQATITATNQEILEYTVPEGKLFYLTNVIVGGNVTDKKYVKVDSTIKIRISHLANDSKIIPLCSYIKVKSGKVITVKNKVATSGEHDATIIGVLYNA